MNKIFRIFYWLILSSLGLVSCVNDSNGPVKEPVDYVDPYIGNISHLLVPTFPTVQLPNSMLRVYPERADYTSEYLNGLPVIVTNHRERSAFTLPLFVPHTLSASRYCSGRNATENLCCSSSSLCVCL